MSEKVPDYVKNNTLTGNIVGATTMISIQNLSSDITGITMTSFGDTTKEPHQLMDQDDAMFFNMYYSPSQFVSECVLAATSVCCNFTALYLSRGHYYQHHAYHSFFKNIAIANALSSLTS